MSTKYVVGIKLGMANYVEAIIFSDRLDFFDEERPPPGTYDDHARIHINQRKERET